MSLIPSLKPINFSVLDTFGALVAAKVTKMFSNIATNISDINERAISASDLTAGIKDGKHDNNSDLKTTNYTIDAEDESIRFSTAADRTALLPDSDIDPINPGKRFKIKDSTGTANTHRVRITCQGDDLFIDGSTFVDLDNDWGVREIELEDTNIYRIVGGYFG